MTNVYGQEKVLLITKELRLALKEIGFDGVCTIEEFRPEYYEMSHDENVKKAAEVTREFVNKYF